MAILLRDLYKETKNTYGLDLIAGEEYLRPYPYAVRSEALPALSYAMGNADLRYHTRLLQSDI